MNTKENKRRTTHAQAALNAYLHHKQECPDLDDSDIVDLISDLLHLAHAAGFDTESTMRKARGNFLVETDNSHQSTWTKAKKAGFLTSDL
jgi:hypothetical protein